VDLPILLRLRLKIEAFLRPEQALMMQHYIVTARNRIRRITKPPVTVTLLNVNGAAEPHGKRALFAWRDTPLLISDASPEFMRHQNLRQCRQIASLLGELGYVVDVADVKDREFRPPKKYDLVISTWVDSGYMDSACGRDAVKIFLAPTLCNLAHNRNLRKRHRRLRERRRFRVGFRKLITEKMPDIPKSDAIMVFGNQYIANTWKEVFAGPIYPFNNYGFVETALPAAKDFASARRNFLFFASRCQIQKGLDLLLEIFRRHPDLHLYVCSFFPMERDFCARYYKELYETPNIHAVGWTWVNSPEYDQLVRQCASVIVPSCSEGQAGSVVQCMYSGLIPLVTREVGIDTEDFGMTFSDDGIEEIERVVLEVARRPESWHRDHSLKTREVAEKSYSEEAFLKRWREVLTRVLRGAGRSVNPPSMTQGGRTFRVSPQSTSVE
jgi:glycosyltransferase involved in cell wall biosynthesis